MPHQLSATPTDSPTSKYKNSTVGQSSTPQSIRDVYILSHTLTLMTSQPSPLQLSFLATHPSSVAEGPAKGVAIPHILPPAPSLCWPTSAKTTTTTTSLELHFASCLADPRANNSAMALLFSLPSYWLEIPVTVCTIFWLHRSSSY